MSTVFNNDYYNDKSITREFSLKNTHIGYENLISAVTASSTAAGFGASALLNSFTYDFWRSSGVVGSLTFDTGKPNPVDYIGIAKHNLLGRKLTLSISTNGADYVEQFSFTPTSNDAIMLIFEEVSARYFKLDIAGPDDSLIEADFTAQNFYFYESGAAYVQDIPVDVIQIAVVNIGKSLEMQRMIFGGHSPAKLNTSAELRPNTSEGGAWLGRSVIRSGVTNEYSFSNLTGDWYRTNFDPFAKFAISEPFFIAWRPYGYASECQFAWTEKPISPNNTGPKDWLSVSFNVVGCE